MTKAVVHVPFIRSSFNYDRDEVSRETSLTCLDESLAVQAAAEEADINTIVRRFGLTGELPDQVAIPRSGDFTNIPDFHTAMNLVRQGQEEFLKVPAEIRARFNNDPQRFMDFLDDDSNRDEAKKLGLLKLMDPPVPPSGTPEGGAA